MRLSCFLSTTFSKCIIFNKCRKLEICVGGCEGWETSCELQGNNHTTCWIWLPAQKAIWWSRTIWTSLWVSSYDIRIFIHNFIIWFHLCWNGQNGTLRLMQVHRLHVYTHTRPYNPHTPYKAQIYNTILPPPRSQNCSHDIYWAWTETLRTLRKAIP
jgi:hypothetical protein